MNPSYEDFVDQTFSKRYRQLELDIMRDIVRRIKKTSEITSSADWQIMRLTIMGNSSEEIRNMIKEAGELSENDMQKLFDDVIEKEYTRSADLYKEVGANFVPYAQNTEMQQLTQALITQSNNELKSITGTMGFMLDYGDGQGLRFTPHTEIFSDYLNNAVMGVASGAFDYNTMIRKVVTQMTNSGLRTVDYASGRHDRVDVAARRAVLTGLSQLTGRITDTNAAALNTDHFEVAWHAGARPTHQEWQGRVWSKKELVDVCGLGSVTGLLGANCYHDYYPFIPGVSERMYSDEWLDQMNREENTPKIFKGKEYTAYEARQHQRYIERCMRAQREKVELLKEGGADKDEVMLARCKYQAQLDEYKRFSKVMKLPEQRERIYYDMKGRVAPPRDVYQQYLADQAEKRRRLQTEADKHKERAEEARRADIENANAGGLGSKGKAVVDSRDSLNKVGKTGKINQEVPMSKAVKDAKTYDELSDILKSFGCANIEGLETIPLESARYITAGMQRANELFGKQLITKVVIKKGMSDYGEYHPIPPTVTVGRKRAEEDPVEAFFTALHESAHNFDHSRSTGTKGTSAYDYSTKVVKQALKNLGLRVNSKDAKRMIYAIDDEWSPSDSSEFFAIATERGEAGSSNRLVNEIRRMLINGDMPK